MMVLHIILGVLKAVGIILLVLLLLVLVSLLLLLFCPVVYEADAHKEEKHYGGKVRVSWLFHALSVKLCFSSEEDAIFSFQIFGIAFEKWKAFFARRKRKEKVKEEAVQLQSFPVKKEERKEPVVQKQSFQQSEMAEVEEDMFDKLDQVFQRIHKFFDGLTGIPGKVVSFFRKIWLTVKKICDKIDKIKAFMATKRYERLKTLFLCHGKRTWMHIRPKKIRGCLKFGTEDPSVTGRLLAVAGIMFPLYGEHLSVEPYFDQTILEGTIFVKGRIYGGFFVHLAILLLLDSDVRFMIKKIKQG